MAERKRGGRDRGGRARGAIPGVRLLGGVLPEKKAAQTFLNRWLRRGLLAGFGVGFTVPYLAILNDVHVEGDEVLQGRCPGRNVVFLANHQTYFLEALAFFDLVYVRHQFPLEDPVLRFSAAEETMKKNLLTKLMSLAGGRDVPPQLPRGRRGRQPPGGHGRRRARRGGDPRRAGSSTSPPAPRRRARPCAPGSPGCSTTRRRWRCPCASTASATCCCTSSCRASSSSAAR